MYNLTLGTDEKLDYSFLLAAYMVCADQQIHSRELKAIEELALQNAIGQSTTAEMEKIFAQDEYQISLEAIVDKIPSSQQSQVMELILGIAHADGVFSPLERQMVLYIAGIWKWPLDKTKNSISNAENFYKKHSFAGNSNEQNLSLNAQVLRGANAIFSRTLINKFAEIAPTNIGDKIQELQREILLSGPEYNDAVKQCAKIANEDYEFAKVALDKTQSILNELKEGINKQLKTIQNPTSQKSRAKTADEVVQELQKTREDLTTEIIEKIRSLQESLAAKQRNLNFFSIAFMGKTKAGKSTIHAIITGEGWDAIGIGKQRTTRFNRVYEWKNIRIIDTPGIGAPGGKTDQEIAQSVIDEADVICYLATNDSLQETEFDFLRVLKEKAKPLVILLNIKNNLRDSRRLDNFLKYPNKLFTMDGQSGIGGHIERIRRYAKQHYTNDYFDIIPVMLLAAQMSYEPENKEIEEELFKSSRIQDFLDSIRLSLVEHGVIRRSQTLLGSTVGTIEIPNQWVIKQSQDYKKLTNSIKNKRHDIHKKIQKYEKDSLKFLETEIESIFQEAVNSISPFAEKHWESDEENMKQDWDKTLKDIKLQDRIDIIYKKANQDFKQRITDLFEEIEQEFIIISQLSGINFEFYKQDSYDLRKFMKYSGQIIGIIGSLLWFTPLAPFSLVVVGAGFIANVWSNFIKTKEERRKDAVQKIRNSLHIQVNNQKNNVLQKVKESFQNSCSEILNNTDSYFFKLINGLESITTQLDTANKKLDGTSNYLNRAYAKRIFDWYCKKSEPLTEENINKVIYKVQRNFGDSINIQIKSEFKPVKSLDEIRMILQEDIDIQKYLVPK